VVSSRISSKPQLNLKRSKVSLQKIAPSSNISLEKRISVLELNVALLAKSINKEADLERKAQRDYEKDVKKQEEKKLRSGEEKQLEKKLSKSILSPVEKQGKRAGGILGKLKDFFMLLLGGWLTNRGFAALTAYAEGDTEQLNSIALEVGKTLAIVGGIFLALNVGILGIVGTIGKIALAITLAPFRFAFNRIRDFFKGRQQSTPKPNAPKPKPTPGSGGGGGSGSKPPGAGGLGRTKPLSPGSASRFSESNLKAFQGKANLGDKLRLFYRGGYKELLKSFMGSGPMQAVKGVVNFLAKAGGFVGGKFLKTAKHVLGLFKPQNLKKVGDALGKSRVLGRLLGPLFALIDIQSRSSSGMSPAQAIIPALLKALLTSGGAVLGGSVPIPFLNVLTSFAGAWAGGWLGDQLMQGIDGIWDKSWDKNFFAGFNNAVIDIGKNDPTGLISKVFPYEGTEKKYTATANPPSTPPRNKPAAKVGNSTGTVSTPPAPAPGGGNTTVVYKKVRGAGAGMQGQPLKTGSATDVPLIASANPSNFYTMYSQLLYNVVN